MRKLYEATGGQPQRWESLGNLGAVKADAAGIAYAVERGWLVISGCPCSKVQQAMGSVCRRSVRQTLLDHSTKALTAAAT